MEKRIRLDEGVLIDLREHSGAVYVSIRRSVIQGNNDDGRHDKLRGGVDRQSRTQVKQPKLAGYPVPKEVLQSYGACRSRT